MPRLNHAIVLIFATVAGLVAAALLYRIIGLDLNIALLSGALIVLVIAHLDSVLAARAAQATVQSSIDALATIQHRLRIDTDVTRRLITSLADEVETKISSRNDRLVSEVRVLEVLIRRLAEGISAKSKVFPAGPDPQSLDPYAPPLSASDFGQGGPDDAQMLEIVRRSLEDNRIDLYLQPIVSLPQRRVRFYEAFSRLRSEDGILIMPSQFIRVAEPAGLMSVKIAPSSVWATAAVTAGFATTRFAFVRYPVQFDSNRPPKKTQRRPYSVPSPIDGPRTVPGIRPLPPMPEESATASAKL